MRKKLIALLIASLMVLVLAGCSTESTTIEAKTYPMRIQLDSAKDPVSDEINLYFINGGDVPYVALSEYMPFVGTIYEDKDINIPAATYEITHPTEAHTMVTRPDNSSFMDINTEEDTIEFVSMDYFAAAPGQTAVMSLIDLNEEGRGGLSNLFEEYGSYSREGDLLTKYDLTEYDIDLIGKDGECYVPLQTINDLLVTQEYVFVVFNGEEVLASRYSANLIDDMYNAPTGEMSEDFAHFNYNELRFMLDSFYGLKPEHGIDNFGDFFMSTGLLSDLSGTDPKAFDRAIQTMTLKYFDDGHSSLLKNSYLAGVPEKKSQDDMISLLVDLGVSNNLKVWDGVRLKSIRSEFYPDHPELVPMEEGEKEPWLYEEIGDTAIITFDSFAYTKQDYYKEADLKNPSDTIELISYAHSKIMREDSPIKNVVVDLSCNGGGAADTAVFLLSWLNNSGNATIAIKDTLTGAQGVDSYDSDINLDGEFDPDDYLDAEIQRYVLISGQSFSCGNLVPCAVKGVSNVTLIGRTSGGGSCIVRPCSSASGTLFTISGPKQISCMKNGSLYNADQGVEPDFVVSKLETLYNREKLVDFIHNLP